MTTTWTEQSKSINTGFSYFLKIDASHYLLIGSSTERLLISPAQYGSVWTEQEKS
jgi:hypothetical protein